MAQAFAQYRIAIFSNLLYFLKIIQKSQRFNLAMDPLEIFTIKELSLYLKLTEKTAYRLASEGKLPGFKVGGSWRFRKTEIDSWIKAQELKAKTEDAQ